MIVAYAVILVGGLLITRRLRLLALAATFWVTLAVGVGILAGSGHCMTANWAFSPVCGLDFWRVIVTSPEVLIFLFFMITDPKTVPGGQVARVAFGFLVAVASTLLMAPQTDEFGTKVGLLGGSSSCARLVRSSSGWSRPGSGANDPGRSRSADRRRGRWSGGALRRACRVGLVACAVLSLGVGIVAAGTPARGFAVPDADAVLGRVPTSRPRHAPRDRGRAGGRRLEPRDRGPGMQEVVVTLAENLELENQALLRATRRSSAPSTTATGSTRCGPAATTPRRPEDGHRPLPVDAST